ncbi:tetratricopeptide repeat protein [bacterium]|nr:tetratricopeptide repeat protein [bacterium]
MSRRVPILLLFVITATTAVATGPTAAERIDAIHPVLGRENDAVLAEVEGFRRTPSADRAEVIRTAAAAPAAGPVAALTIDYPRDESVFPPEIVPPTFLWHDPAEACDTWLVDVAVDGGHLYALAAGPAPPPGEIDPRCISPNNEIYQPTPYQASARSWTPAADVWEAIKKGSKEKPAPVTISGFRAAEPGRVLSRGHTRIATSQDPVGAPIFYRDVPLMPAKTEEGVIQPLAPDALPLIQWRLRDISRDSSRVVLRDMATCGNCHSFSADGKTLAMDIDGPTGDKGAYAIAPIAPEMTIEEKDIITWNSFPDKAAGQKTIGFLSQISPDGKIAVTTLNEELYVRNFSRYQLLQVFYPTRGILAWYNVDTKEMKALPGADDPQYVHCDPAWSPDGRWLVFARAAAGPAYPAGKPRATFANDPNETPLRYDLYRIPFNGGQGGRPEPIRGASDNKLSNTFPKVSPDGKWIVFVKCRNGQLMRPDGRLWIVPFAGGAAREMRCNTSLMNSWHSFSPNGRWMVFSSKANTPYTQMFLTHLDENGDDSPPILIPHATAANRAVNIPEFVNIPYDGLQSISTPTVEYYRDFARGTELMKQGQFAAAEAALRQALEKEPSSSRISCQLGVALMEQKRSDEAVRYFRRALETDPGLPDAQSNLGYALLALGRPQEALQQFEATRYSDQLADVVQAGMGLAQLGLGNHEEAIGHFRRALELNPRQHRVHANLGGVLVLKGLTDEAIKHFETAIEINPRSTVAHLNLARVLARQEKDEAALDHYRAAIESTPDLIEAHREIAVLYLKRGDAGQATRHFVRLVELEPEDASARSNLGAVLAQQGKMPEALAHFEKAVALNPQLATAHYNLGKALLGLGKADAGIAHLRKAVEIDPGYAPARQDLESALRVPPPPHP